MSDLDVAAIREQSQRLGFDDTDGSSRRQRTSSRSAMLFEYDGDAETHRMRLDPSKDPSDPGWLSEIEQDARSFDGKLPKTSLNGNGQKYDDCGEVELPVQHCTDCLERKWADRTCRRAACPRCHESHEFYNSVTDAAKAEALRRKRNAKNGVTGTAGDLIHHGVASLPLSFAIDSSKPLKRGKEILAELLLACNIDTSQIYYHPYRIKKAYRGDVNGHASGDGDMTWSDIFGKLDTDKWTEEAVIDEFLVFAPHFHFIAVTPNFEGGVVTEQIQNQTGIVIHRITKSGKNDNVSIYGIEDLCRAIAYCRTHTGLRWNEENEEFQTAMWRTGEVANLDASDGVTAEIDAAMRSVSADVLGVDFSRADSCREKVPVEGPSSDSDESADESSSWSPSPSPVSAAGPADDRSLGPDAGSLNLPDGTAMTDGGSTWDATSGVVPDFAGEPMPDTPEDRENSDTERCGGDFVPMKYAPMYFTDADLQETMPDRVEALERDYKIWQEGGRTPD